MFSINYQSREPIYEQLYNNVIRLLSLGVLVPEQQLPPVRQLATQLGVNPNTVSKAYKNLEQDGIIYSVVGKGSFIMPDIKVADGKKADALNKVTQAVKVAMELGVEKKEIIAVTENVYNKGVDKL
ncbi:MAG: GntR family transcriptional regulator [Acutalibacteraceae bacterium]|nr:GntR family transcriptional regulator [Acutalibacteraceae bacterium]